MKNHISRSMFEMMQLRSGFFAKLGAHQTMLMDMRRCAAYKKALHATIKPGDVVVDIGTGTGILALLAAKAGARQVYAIESTDMSYVAEQIVKQNGLERQIKIIQGDARELSLPEKANIIVSETIGFWGIDENIVNLLHIAKKKFGLPSTIVIPDNLSLFLTPIESYDAYSSISFWQQNPYSFDFAPIAKLAKNNIYIRLELDSDGFLAPPKCVADFELGDKSLSYYKCKAQFRIKRSGTFHGLAGWFSARLADTIKVSTDPRREILHWKHCFFPVDSPSKILRGQTVACELQAHVGDVNEFEWLIKVYEPRKNTPTTVSRSTTREFSLGKQIAR